MTQTFTFRIEADQLRAVKVAAHEQSIKTGIDVSHADLIRNLIATAYPVANAPSTK